MIPELASQFFDAPSGPDNPFGTPTLVILDSLRMMVIVLGFIVITLTPSAMMKTRRSPGQFTRIGVMALFIIGAIGTEIAHVGDYAHWRLIVNIFAAIGAAWGMWSLFLWEEPAKITKTIV